MKKLAVSCSLMFLSFLPAVNLQAAQKASVAGKKISYHTENSSVGEALAEISRQSGADFCVPEELSKKRVAVVADKFQLETVMEYLGKVKRLEFSRDERRGCYVVAMAKSRLPFPPFSRKELTSPLLRAKLKKMSMETDLKTALEDISSQSGADFIVLEDAERSRVRLDLEKATLGDALEGLRNQKMEFSRISGTALFVVRPALSTQELSGVQTGPSGKAESDPEESRYSLIRTLRD